VSERLPTALLVDDEAAWIEPVASWLRRRGWRVRRAFQAERAMELLHREQPDLVWLDIYIEPGSERFRRLLRRVAHSDHWGGVLVLEEVSRMRPQPELVVATASVTNVVELRRLCGIDFRLLQKPIDTAEATELLTEIMDRVAGRP
jgi:CheY-like chemotaxis protein